MNLPQKLSSAVYDKIWGSEKTQPWYENPESRKIGELWFAASETMPLLVKFLFTSDNLSIQVHPNDEHAQEHHSSPGKTEMWHIVRAEPDARIALGLINAITGQDLREAAESGKVENLLNWLPARPGDTFFVPAGAIHGIGGGIVLCEIQQRSNVTYRLYDYGRGRELHLDHAIAVADLAPVVADCRSQLPLECPYFRTERLEIAGRVTMSPGAETIYVALEGNGSFAGRPFRAGEAWEIPEDCEPFDIASPSAVFLVTCPL